MKYIIIPIAKFIAVILIYLLGYPIIFIISCFWALWHWDLGLVVTPKNSIFSNADISGDYVYKTAWDWFRDNRIKSE